MPTPFGLGATDNSKGVDEGVMAGDVAGSPTPSTGGEQVNAAVHRGGEDKWVEVLSPFNLNEMW